MPFSSWRSAATLPTQEAPKLAPWRQNLDLAGWAAEIRAVEKEFKEGQGEADVQHLKKMLNISVVMYLAGLLLAPVCKLPWNPISAFLISTSICVRWTMIAHHCSHGGYNSQVGTESRFHRMRFGRGLIRRCADWLDWMLPEAWDVEHNYLHHYELGEATDPDLVERNTHSIRQSKLPVFCKYLEMFALMTMWKWFYYTPNTLKEMYGRQKELADRRGEKAEQPFDVGMGEGDYASATRQATIKYAWAEAMKMNFKPSIILAKVMAPYFTAHFVATPLLFRALLGPAAGLTVFANMVAAEILTNMHSFLIIACNHAGRDMYRFNTPVKVKSDEFYLRAVIGSVNFKTGGDFNDMMHGWLNYQIEHHLFPDVSMLSYQRMQPRVKAICQKYGVPYVQENVFKRLWMTFRIGVGQDSMLVWERGD